MWRRPDRSTLTPCRIGAADHPRADRTGRSRVVNTERVTLPDDGCGRAGLGARALLDDDEFGTGVVDTGRVEPDRDL